MLLFVLVLFPLLQCFILVLRHAEHLLKFIVVKVIFFHISLHARGELPLEVIIREFLLTGFSEALKGVGGCMFSCRLDFFSFRNLFVHLDLKGVGVNPFVDDVLLPVRELDLKMGGLLAGKHFNDADFLGVTAVLNLVNVLFSAFDSVRSLVLVRLVADPDVDGVVGVKDLAILIVKILLHEAKEFLDEHVTSGVRDVEKSSLKVSGHVHVTG